MRISDWSSDVCSSDLTVAGPASLAADGTYTRTVTAPVLPPLPGDYHVIAITDATGLVTESNEADNTAVLDGTLEVTVPDLVVEADQVITLQPGEVRFRRIAPEPDGAGQIVEAITAGDVSMVASDGTLPTDAAPDPAPLDPDGDPLRLLLPGDDAPPARHPRPLGAIGRTALRARGGKA